jgi:tetratricopeptide (TPR) repeat protein
MSLEPEQGSLEEQLHSREAFLVYLDKGADEAIALLAGKTDPDSIARHLSILLRGDRVADAVALIRGRQPAEKWCNLAAYAFAKSGDFDGGEWVLGRTKAMSDRLYQQRSAMAFAQGCIELVVGRSGKSGAVAHSALKGDDLAVMRRARSALDDAFIFDEVRSPLAEHAACLALNAYAALGDREAAERVATSLARRSPVPLSLADAVLTGNVAAPDGFVARLRNEHPNSFDARLKASLIEGMFQGRPGPALASAMALKDMPLGQEQKADLLRALYKLASLSGQGATDLVDSLVPDLLSQDDPEFKLFSVDQYLRRGDLDAAAALIDGARDEGDPSWTQAAAVLREKRGDVDGAIALLLKVAPSTASLGMLMHAASLAYQHRRLGAALTFLQRAVEVAPKDRDARQNLALVCGQVGDFRRAAEHYRLLRDAHPDDPAYSIRLAASLALGDRLDQSLEVYEVVCRSEAAPVEAHLGRARVLWSLNRPEEGLAALEAVRDRYWDNPAFLLSLLSAAHASGRDELAAPVLRRLADLDKGKDGGEAILQVKSLDEVKAFLLQQRELQETLAKQLLTGHVPWLLADSQTHRVPYFGWAVRTRQADWIPEDVNIWAAATVYATNNFTVTQRRDGHQIVPIACPGKEAAVVADMTALITLHGLGLLDRLSSRFSEVLVPATYFPRALDERANLLPHQLSRRNASADLSRALDGGCLGVYRESEPPSGKPPPLVEEHTLEDEESAQRYRLIDVGQPLYQAGVLAESQFQRLQKMAHRPSATGEGLPALELGWEIVCQLSTLQALASAGLLDPVLAGFRVKVTVAEEHEIRHTERQYQFQETIAAKHSDMWKQVGDTSKFKRVPVEVPADWIREDGEEPGRHVSMAASMVALQLKTPLLADDRTCQVLILNQEPRRADAAFGTSHLLSAMVEDGSLTAGVGATAFLQLMRWRYRFVLPPVEVLMECAHQFRQHPPGRLLREIAAYAHDCMRDPGLLNGPEKSSLPISMGVRLFNAWTHLAGEFVLAVWSDARFGDEAAQRLTRWAVNELLLSPPAGHSFHWQRICAAMAQKSILDGALLRCLYLDPSDRTRAGFQALGQALGLSGEEYRRAVTEIIDGF